MKTFIIALVTFCLLVLLMIVNFIYFDNVMGRLIIFSEGIDDYPEPGTAASAAFSAMRHYWEKHKFIISLTIGQKVVDQIDSLMIDLVSAQRTGDSHSFYKAKSLITEGFIKIRRSENLSIEGIL